MPILRVLSLLSLSVALFAGAACSPQVPTEQAMGEQLPATQSVASVQITDQVDSSAMATPQAGVSRSATLETDLPGVPVALQYNVILGRPTADAITISVSAQEAMQVAILYGALAGAEESQTAPVSLPAGSPYHFEITGLTPDTSYWYQVLSNGLPSDQHSFHTQRSPGSGFTFTIDADPHYTDPRFNSDLYSLTLSNALVDHPDFHINLGDTFMTEKIKPRTYAGAESTFAGMRPFLGILGADVPIYLVNGNHEGELGWLLLKGQDRQFPIWSTRLRQQYFPHPVPGGFYQGSTVIDSSLGEPRDGYYSWSWGAALFVVLDPFWYTLEKPRAGEEETIWNWTLGKEQYDWLRSTLETSTAKYKFIFTHHLVGGNEEGRGGAEIAGLYEWGGRNRDGSYGFDDHRPGWGKPIHQLLVENHVSAVFHGHDHVFVKQVLDGIVYQEVPQPSNTQYKNTRLGSDYGYLDGDMSSSSGHLRVNVSPLMVTVDYVRAYLDQDQKDGRENRQVDYTYTIP